MLPGSPVHPLATTDLEAKNQIIKLLFQLNNTLGSINTSLHNIDLRLQSINSRIR
jgi:hypothetical protein